MVCVCASACKHGSSTSVVFCQFLQVTVRVTERFLQFSIVNDMRTEWSVRFARTCRIYAAGKDYILASFGRCSGRIPAMLTYTAADLWSLCHTRPLARAVRKALFNAHLWLPARVRQSADELLPVSLVPGKYSDLQKLRAGWLNVRSLANKTDAVREAINAENLDVLVLTESWHHTSDDICLRQALPDNFAVIDAVREAQPGYGGIAVLYSALLKCTRVEIPPSKTFEALCIKLTASSSALLLLCLSTVQALAE